MAAGDVVVQGTTDGRLVGFDAATGDPLGEYRVPDARVSSPAVCGDRYVVGVGNDATAVRALTVGR